MTEDRTAIVVTTVFEAGQALQSIAAGAAKKRWELIVIGDRKSPRNFHLEGSRYFDLEAQRQTDLALSKLCPEGHYTRKNIGYLLAMKAGNSVIIETDDDNIPRADFWMTRTRTRQAAAVTGKGWHNVYGQFSSNVIWPRGFPLECIHSADATQLDAFQVESECPIQQGLADENPDVDAIFRMTRELPFNFSKPGYTVVLRKGVWCPFNSQNTTWFKEAFPLLYLPSYCSFRMTDIWRSFVAQRIAWECGWGVLFHSATMYQERNEHNLLRDFEQEVPGYLHNGRIVRILENLTLSPGTGNITANLVTCYEKLVAEKIIESSEELTLLRAWIDDL